MYTVCPKCALPLAVTAADLRAGQGYVRCGRCANVFNALLRLSEESAQREAAGDEPAPFDIEHKASATLSRPALGEADVPFPPEIEYPSEETGHTGGAEARPDPVGSVAAILSPAEFEDPDSTNPKIGIAPLQLVPPEPTTRSSTLWLVDSPSPPPPAAIDSEEPMSELDDESDEEFDFVDDEEPPRPRGTGTFETIVLEGDTFLQTEETIPEEVLDSEIADVSRRIAEANHGGEFPDRMDVGFFDAHEDSERAAAPELAALREATGEFKPAATPGIRGRRSGRLVSHHQNME